MALFFLQFGLVLTSCSVVEEVCRLRRLAPHVPLVLYAIQAEEVHLARMLDAGADDYLQLTLFGRDELHSRLRRHVRCAREQQETQDERSAIVTLESEDQQICLMPHERSVEVRGHTLAAEYEPVRASLSPDAEWRHGLHLNQLIADNLGRREDLRNQPHFQAPRSLLIRHHSALV